MNVLDDTGESRLVAGFQREGLSDLRSSAMTNDQQSEVVASVSNSFVIDSKLTSVMKVGVTEENQGSVARSGRRRRERPQYERDGWERLELECLSRVQLCRTDERWSTSRHSHTVSFRKK